MLASEIYLIPQGFLHLWKHPDSLIAERRTHYRAGKLITGPTVRHGGLTLHRPTDQIPDGLVEGIQLIVIDRRRLGISAKQRRDER